MRNLLLATALIVIPVAAFTGYTVYVSKMSVMANAPAATLGDLSSFSAIITDVQSKVARGDLAAAKARIKDFEIAWDDNETGLKPMDPAHWGQIDAAADAGLLALREGTPDPTTVTANLVTLQATLQSKAAVVQ